MNLYFRLILILLKSAFTTKLDVLEESRLKYRAWPLDCDINFHLTNARYFSLCDLSRIYYMSQLGILFQLIKKKWLPVAQAQEISYFKQINPFQEFEVVTRLTHWDNKYWYTEHRFFAANQLHATLQVRGVFVHSKRVLPFRDVLALTGENVQVPETPVTVEHWQTLIASKKEPKRTRPTE